MRHVESRLQLLTGSCPEFELPKLQYLYISGCQNLSGELPSFSHVPELLVRLNSPSFSH